MLNKLELNWIGKHDPQNKISLEPRIFIEKQEYSYAIKNVGKANSTFEAIWCLR